MLRVQRQIRRTRLEDAEEADESQRPPLEEEADDRLRPDAAADEVVSNDIGQPVQLAVGQRFLAEHEGQRVRRSRRGPLESVVNADFRVGQLRTDRPPLEDPVPIVRRENGQVREPSHGVGGDRREQAAEPRGHLVDRLVREQVRAVLPGEAEPITVPRGHQGQVEQGRPPIERDRFDGESMQVQPGAGDAQPNGARPCSSSRCDLWCANITWNIGDRPGSSVPWRRLTIRLKGKSWCSSPSTTVRARGPGTC